MPYIAQTEREKFFPDIFQLSQLIETPGQLNYVITYLAHQYLNNKGLKYSNLNEVVGVLTCAQLELYRMQAAPYEDQKLLDHGPV